MNNPTEKEVVKAKIDNGEVKVKGRRKAKQKTTKPSTATAQPTAEQTKQPKEKAKRQGLTEEQVLAVMHATKAEKGADFVITSTVIRDAFNLPNRAAARLIMKGLSADKVRIVETGGNGKRKQYHYELVA